MQTIRVGVVRAIGRLAGAAAVLAGARSAHAENLTIDEDTSLTLSALLQPQAVVAQDAAPDGGPGTDFFLRRARLILAAQLDGRVSFFVDTEQANLGKDGNWETSVFVQDAFLSLRLVAGLTVDAGMMLIPFTRHDLQSAASLNGLDYHTRLILFPAAGNRVWRDAGVQVRGDLAGGRVQVRAGVFNGVEGLAAEDPTMMDDRNPSDLPRLAGHARYNLLGGPENGFFYPGIAFSEHPMLSVGVGADWQANAVMNAGTAEDHLGLAVDAFAEIPGAAGQEGIFQATGVRYDDGPAATSTGMGFFVEAGYRVGWIEPIAAVDYFDADLDAGDFRGFHLGADAFIDKHRTNVKLDLAYTRQGTGSDLGSASLQAQLFF